MSKYKLLYKRPSAKDINRLSPQVQKRLKLKLEWFITQEDPIKFAEPLTKPVDAQYRFRIGTYRILFDIESSSIVVLRVQHRRDVYR